MRDDMEDEVIDSCVDEVADVFGQLEERYMLRLEDSESVIGVLCYDREFWPGTPRLHGGMAMVNGISALVLDGQVDRALGLIPKLESKLASYEKIADRLRWIDEAVGSSQWRIGYTAN